MRGLQGEHHLSSSLTQPTITTFCLSRTSLQRGTVQHVILFPNHSPVTLPCQQPTNIDRSDPKRVVHKRAGRVSPLQRCGGRCSSDEVCSTNPFQPVVPKVLMSCHGFWRGFQNFLLYEMFFTSSTVFHQNNKHKWEWLTQSVWHK